MRKQMFFCFLAVALSAMLAFSLFAAPAGKPVLYGANNAINGVASNAINAEQLTGIPGANFVQVGGTATAANSAALANVANIATVANTATVANNALNAGNLAGIPGSGYVQNASNHDVVYLNFAVINSASLTQFTMNGANAVVGSVLTFGGQAGNNVTLAVANNVNRLPAVCIARGAASNGAVVNCITSGVLSGIAGVTWTRGATLAVSATAGNITACAAANNCAAVGSAGNFVQILGVAQGTNAIDFRPLMGIVGL